jgi:hypothetical protein
MSLKKIIRKYLLEETKKSPLTQSEIKFFKILNNNKHKYKTKKELLSYIISMMPFIGKHEDEGQLYYELYAMNYRPEGDYENITPEEFMDVRKIKQIRTPNVNAYTFTRSKIPFKGSNLEGHWGVNGKNEPYYVVKSYDWYPIYLFINNQWYENFNTYSRATQKQIRYSDPIRYEENLNSRVIGVSKKEIEDLMYGDKTFDELKKKRQLNFIDEFENNQDIKKSYLVSFPDYEKENAKKVKYKITDVKLDNNEIVIYVDIEKAGKLEDRKMVPNDYIVPSPFSEDLENKLKQYITHKYFKFLKENPVKFIFNHPSNK